LYSYELSPKTFKVESSHESRGKHGAGKHGADKHGAGEYSTGEHGAGMVSGEHPQRVLILGGTSEAIALATQAAQHPDLEIITALAGRTQHPQVPGQVRLGGFGGAAGLADYLYSQKICALVDATHPFAAQMSWNAAAAAAITKIPHLILTRSPWQPVKGDRWIEVEDHEAAAAMLPELANRVFLTIGRQELAAYEPLKALWFLMRMIDAPAPDAPIPPGQVVLARGPFTLDNERSLLLTYGIEAIVSKNSGGTATYPKLEAARELGLPVLMIQRPPMPTAQQTGSISDALHWILECSQQRRELS
jgi:precorrin-6A/cobalt-precorrin-6A reductase